MTQTLTTRFASFVLAAAVFAAVWTPTVTVPHAAPVSAVVAAVA